MIKDKWSNEPIKAEVIKTGEVVTGFTDGHGHFDVPIDHSIFVRYNLSEIEDDGDTGFDYSELSDAFHQAMEEEQ